MCTTLQSIDLMRQELCVLDWLETAEHDIRECMHGSSPGLTKCLRCARQLSSEVSS